MDKLILFLAVFFSLNNSQAQTKKNVVREFTIEPCTSTIGIATKDNRSTLWNYKTKRIIGELDSSLYQFYPETKCLIKATSNDSIYCYDLQFDLPKFLFSDYQELRIDFINEFFILFNGKLYDLGPEVHECPNSLEGSFGIELLVESAIIIDFKFRGQRGTIPLTDSLGNNIIRTDLVTGLDYYSYEKGMAGYSHGGVRNRLGKEWIIEPSANWIVNGFSTYVAERTEFLSDTDFKCVGDERLYTIYDHQGRILEQSLSDSQLINTPEYLNCLVPNYKCDSVYLSSEMHTLLFRDNLYFKTEGKIGYFRITTNEIIHEPVDFLLWSSPIHVSVHTSIENDSVAFDIIDRIEKFRITPGNKFEFYSVLGYKHASLTFRIKNEIYDSVFTYLYKYSNVIDSIISEDFVSSSLNSVLDPNLKNDSFGLNLMWQFSFEVTGRNQLIVTNNKMEFNGDDGAVNSGVFDLKKYDWIISPTYHSVIQVEGGFKAFLTDSRKAEPKFDLYDLAGELLNK